MTDKTELIREIHEYVTAHGGENTATHLLVQAASTIQTHTTAATAAAEQLRRIKSTANIMQYAPDSQAIRDSLHSLAYRAIEALKALDTPTASATPEEPNQYLGRLHDADAEHSKPLSPGNTGRRCMSTEAKKHIGEGMAWLGFWLGLAAVLVACVNSGWRPWE